MYAMMEKVCVMIDKGIVCALVCVCVYKGVCIDGEEVCVCYRQGECVCAVMKVCV